MVHLSGRTGHMRGNGCDEGHPVLMAPLVMLQPVLGDKLPALLEEASIESGQCC